MARVVKIGDVEISAGLPRLISNEVDLNMAKESEKYADIIELRLDYLEKSPDIVRKKVQEYKKVLSSPLIATIRRAGEGGKWYAFEGTERERKSIFEKVYDLVDAVDIEDDSEIRNDVLKEAKNNNLASILSYHQFFKIEKNSEIKERLKKMHDTDANILKLAYYCENVEDTFNLLDALLHYNQKFKDAKPITVIGMGEIGRYTRLVFPMFGACITYGYLKNGGPRAPGQLSVQCLRKWLDRFYEEKLPLSLESKETKSVMKDIAANLNLQTV